MKRVVITGLGTVNPLGSTVEKFWENVKKGTLGVSKIDSFDTTELGVSVAGIIRDFDPAEYFDRKDIRHMERFTQIAVASAVQALKDAVEKDCCHRAASVKEEIAFALQHEDLAGIFGKLLENGEVPLRVTHNDTKLNNIMIDLETGKGICVVDLDTVMPGLAMNDFGDAIRFGASTALEDEKDLSKVSCDMELYEIYVKGFLESCGDKLNAREIEMLPMGAKVMTYECGIRFLTDYLEGDHYFKIDREDHNLDRCRTQFKLVADMEQKWEQMQAIVKKYQK